MNCYGIEFSLRHTPALDPDYAPLYQFNHAFLKDARKPIGIAVERSGGQTAVYETFIHGTPEMARADRYYVDRLVKTILWMKGGFRVYVRGDEEMFQTLKEAYAPGGSRAFDAEFMAGVYEHPFEVVSCRELPPEKDESQPIGRHLEGCRIGFDAGGSDRKVSAVIDGESVFSEEVVWFPKVTEDPDYHFQGIVDAMKSAAAHMPRVDAIGVSSAGIYIENRTMVASLFLKDNNVLGIAMGTSEAVGYVDQKGNITGWLNELAFMPVDAAPNAMVDEWSGDIGCGVKYFSQDGVIKLAPAAGIELDEKLSPAEKLKVVQGLMEAGDARAASVYQSIGVYLAHALALYYDWYHYKHVLLLGRVMSGKGGDLILSTCKEVMADEYPEIAAVINPTLPDEKFRRVGQSAAAASLPDLAK